MDREDFRKVKLCYMGASIDMQLDAQWTIEILIHQIKTNPFFNDSLKKNHPQPQTYQPILQGDQVNIYKDQSEDKMPLNLSLSRYKPKKSLVFKIEVARNINKKQKESEFKYSQSQSISSSISSSSPKKQVNIAQSNYIVRLDSGKKYNFELKKFQKFKDLSSYIKKQLNLSRQVKIQYFNENNQQLKVSQNDNIEKNLLQLRVNFLLANVVYVAGS